MPTIGEVDTHLLEKTTCDTSDKSLLSVRVAQGYEMKLFCLCLIAENHDLPVWFPVRPKGECFIPRLFMSHYRAIQIVILCDTTRFLTA